MAFAMSNVECIFGAAIRLWDFLVFRCVTRGGRFNIPDEPAFTPASLEWFCDAIESSKFYLEFGTGASTKLAAEAGCAGIAVESDRRWADALVNVLAAHHRLTLIHADVGMVGAWGYPVFRFPTNGRIERWNRYTSLALREIDRIGGFTDLVLIDGRFRRACALSIAATASEKLANTTIMFDDYRERKHYHAVEPYLGVPCRMLERAALFHIVKGKLPRPISEEVIRSAHLDVR